MDDLHLAVNPFLERLPDVEHKVHGVLLCPDNIGFLIRPLLKAQSAGQGPAPPPLLECLKHSFAGALAVLVAPKLRDRGQHIRGKLASRGLEFDVLRRRLNLNAEVCKVVDEVLVVSNTSSQSVEFIDDDGGDGAMILITVGK
jgi:hypothetical protein